MRVVRWTAILFSMVLVLTACSPQPSPTTSPSLGLVTPPATVRTSDPTVGVSDGAASTSTSTAA